MSAEPASLHAADHWLDLAKPGWEIKKISYVAKLASGHTPSRQRDDYWVDCTIPWISLGDVAKFRGDRTVEIAETKEKISPAGLANSAAELLPKGTVCLSRTASVGFSVIMGRDMATTQDFANWICGKTLLPKFLLYSLRAMRPDFERLKMGSTHNTIYMPDIGTLQLAVPSVELQRRAIDFIEREAARIDTLIDKQKKLIELLKEKRQAVISQAVTKGLDPDVPMKDSGVECLGEVPSEWRVVRLMDLVDDRRQIMYGIVLPGPSVEDGVLIVKGGDVKPGRLDPKRLSRTTYDIEAGYARSRLTAGDLVYSIRGTIGDVQLVPESIEGANLTQDAARIAPKDGVDRSWLVAAMESTGVFGQLEVNSLGAAVRGINIRDLKKARIPVPPLEEQRSIANYLEKVLTELSRTVQKVKEQLDLLAERRTALITAAVTGQIDVSSCTPATEPAVA